MGIVTRILATAGGGGGGGGGATLNAEAMIKATMTAYDVVNELAIVTDGSEGILDADVAGETVPAALAALDVIYANIVRANNIILNDWINIFSLAGIEVTGDLIETWFPAYADIGTAYDALSIDSGGDQVAAAKAAIESAKTAIGAYLAS